MARIHTSKSSALMIGVSTAGFICSETDAICLTMPKAAKHMHDGRKRDPV